MLFRPAFRFAVVLSCMFSLALVARTTFAQESETPDVMPADSGQPGQLQTIAAVAVAGYDNLMGDVNFLGQLTGQPEQVQMIAGMSVLFTQGLDKTKPVGILVQTDGMQVHPIGCLPVTDIAGLLATAQGFQATVTENDDGTKTLTRSDGKMLYIKQSGNWAYLAAMPHSLVALPEDPEAALRSALGEYDIAAQISVHQIPIELRQKALQGIRGGMQEGLKQQEGEDDLQFEARQKIAQAQMASLQQIFEEVDQITLGLNINQTDQRVYLDAVYTAVPGTKLAEQMAAYGEAKTNFAGFAQPDAAVMMTFASKMAPAEIEQMKQMLTAARQQVAAEIDKDEDIPNDAARETIKSAVGDFMDALESTLAGGVIDGGAVVQMDPESLTVVAGGLVTEPAKIESGLKKLASVAEEEPEFSGFKWNADNHQGVSFHTMTAPVPEDQPEARRMFGEKMDIAVGIGQNAVYFAAGKGNIEAAKKAIDQSLAEPNKAVPPFEMSISLAQVMTTAAAYAKEEDKAQVEGLAEALKTQAQGRDHVRMIGTAIPNGLRYRLEAEEGVLKAIGTAAANQQQAGAF